jgi:hypothetical protein
MTKREYILAADPFRVPSSGQVMREVMERIDSGSWSVCLVVANDRAVEVLDALRRAYRDGREDHAGEYGPDRWQVLRNWLTGLESAMRPADVVRKMNELDQADRRPAARGRPVVISGVTGAQYGDGNSQTNMFGSPS